MWCKSPMSTRYASSALTSDRTCRGESAGGVAADLSTNRQGIVVIFVPGVHSDGVLARLRRDRLYPAKYDARQVL